MSADQENRALSKDRSARTRRISWSRLTAPRLILVDGQRQFVANILKQI